MEISGKFILVGLSGGPDSVALLHRLSRDIDPTLLLATHCNFHLRGNESMRDQRFCEELCRRLGIPLTVKHFDTRAVMANEHLSLELAARRLRYDWWEALANEKERETGREVVIAVGHHRDDSIETLLMNLMRGTGIKGLTGIPRCNGRIIRPLSDMTRADILAYLHDHQLDYVTDSTNAEDDTVRNAIRNRLLPLMEQINPNAREGITRTIRHLQATRTLAEWQLDSLFASTQRFDVPMADVSWHEFRLPDSILADDPLAETLFHHWSERYGKARRAGRLFYTEIPDLSHQRFTLAHEPAAESGTPDSQSSLFNFHFSLFTFQFSIFNSPSLPPFSRDCELFDADSLQWPLTLRHWQTGDRIQPLGMKGSRLVSDLFTDAHFSPNRKATTWILADASGRILWVVGLRVADWCKVKGTTARVLKIIDN